MNISRFMITGILGHKNMFNREDAVQQDHNASRLRFLPLTILLAAAFGVQAAATPSTTQLIPICTDHWSLTFCVADGGVAARPNQIWLRPKTRLPASAKSIPPTATGLSSNPPFRSPMPTATLQRTCFILSTTRSLSTPTSPSPASNSKTLPILFSSPFVSNATAAKTSSSSGPRLGTRKTAP